MTIILRDNTLSYRLKLPISKNLTTL